MPKIITPKEVFLTQLLCSLIALPRYLFPDIRSVVLCYSSCEKTADVSGTTGEALRELEGGGGCADQQNSHNGKEILSFEQILC